MKIHISENYEIMSKKALAEVEQLMQKSSNSLICTASGDSPAGLYKELVNKANLKQLNVEGWHFVSLDEWAGMNEADEGSCRYHLNNQLFNPLKIPPGRICFFNGRATDLESECRRIEDYISRHEEIDVAIVGLGMNGHVGMNEPGTPASSHTHVAKIDEMTQQIGQKYFKEPQSLSHGLTLGIASLMQARNVILMVTGPKKAEIVQQVFEGEISEALPASLLRNHFNLQVFLDSEAAAGLQAQVI